LGLIVLIIRILLNIDVLIYNVVIDNWLSHIIL
jgi:hypothetical protein